MVAALRICGEPTVRRPSVRPRPSRPPAPGDAGADAASLPLPQLCDAAKSDDHLGPSLTEVDLHHEVGPSGQWGGAVGGGSERFVECLGVKRLHVDRAT